MSTGILIGFLIGCVVVLVTIYLGGGFDNYGD